MNFDRAEKPAEVSETVFFKKDENPSEIRNTSGRKLVFSFVPCYNKTREPENRAGKGEERMKILKFEDLVSHDVLEFCYSVRYPEHWNFDSIFVYDDEFFCLSSCLEQVIPNYNYFGAQKVTLEEWKQIKKFALEKNEYQDFFYEVDKWIKKDPEQNNSFWIYGV